MSTCAHTLTAPCGPAHRDVGLDRFCMACSVFFDAAGTPTTAPPMAVRNRLADRLQSARPDGALDGLAHTLRHGGSLN